MFVRVACGTRLRVGQVAITQMVPASSMQGTLLRHHIKDASDADCAFFALGVIGKQQMFTSIGDGRESRIRHE